MSKRLGPPDIATLRNRAERPRVALENELSYWGRTMPAAAVVFLPALNADSVLSALEDLRDYAHLSDITVIVTDPEATVCSSAYHALHSLPQRIRIVWSHSHRLSRLDESLNATDIALPRKNHGRELWYALGSLLSDSQAEVVAVYRGDDAVSHPGLLSRLIYPLMSPFRSYELCKTYRAVAVGDDPEAALVTPFLAALAEVFGANDYLQRLGNFLYPLSGGLAFRRSQIGRLRFVDLKDGQLALLSELQRGLAIKSICQIDDGVAASRQASEPAPFRFETHYAEFAMLLLDYLRSEGVVINSSALQTVKLSFHHKALDCLIAQRSDCQVNGMILNLHEAEMLIEHFSETVFEAGCSLISGAYSLPTLPSWNRAVYAVPDLLDTLNAALDADLADFAPPSYLPLVTDQHRPTARH